MLKTCSFLHDALWSARLRNSAVSVSSFNIIKAAVIQSTTGSNLFFLSSLIRRASSVASVDGSIMSSIPCPSIVQSVVVSPKKGIHGVDIEPSIQNPAGWGKNEDETRRLQLKDKSCRRHTYITSI